MEARGFVYLLAGETYADLLCVSLHSLRRFSDEPATVFCTDGRASQLAHRIAEDRRLRLAVRVVEPSRLRKGGRRQAYCTKPLLSRETPYRQTVLLDADTVVQQPIDELFAYPLSVTRFALWVSTGKIVAGRINQWRGLSPYADALVERALAIIWPAINTGVVGFARDFPGMQDWRALTALGARCSFADELAMQLLYPSYQDCHVFNDRWNCSAKFSEGHGTARVIHFHGRSHVRKDGGWQLWSPFLSAAMADDAGGISQWAGRFDPGVRYRLQADRRAAARTAEAEEYSCTWEPAPGDGEESSDHEHRGDLVGV